MIKNNLSGKIWSVTITLILLNILVFSVPIAIQAKEVLDSDGHTHTIIDSDGGQKVTTLANPIKAGSIGEIVNVATKYFTYVAILCAVLAIIWVGFQFVLAQGKPEKIKETSKWLTYIMVGVAVILGARLMIMIVLNTLGATGAVDSNLTQSATQALNGK